MSARPEVFISTTSKDLRTCRQLVRDGLLTLGCLPVVQEHFPPDTRTVREMLREKVAACDAVIHIAGECYGAEPREYDATQPRRSYTQLEYDVARELDKPLYTFICSDTFPYDPHETEPEELQELQRRHRAALMKNDHLYLPIKDKHDVEVRVRELQTRVEGLARDLSKTRSWLGRGVAAGLILLTGVGGLMWWQHTGSVKTDTKVAQMSDELDRYRQAVKALADQYGKEIDPGRTLTDEEKLDRAIASVAAQEKISPGELKTWMALFVAQVRGNPGTDFYDKALADFATQKFVDAASNATQAAENYQGQREAAEKEAAASTKHAGEARAKEREAWTLAGNSQYAAGHYREAVNPYRKALDLLDEQKDAPAWCDAAEQLELSLWHQGLYPEAESLARGIVEKSAIALGSDNLKTLVSVEDLGNVYYTEGNYDAAEPLYQRALEGFQRSLGSDSRFTLGGVNSLASVYLARHDYKTAEPLYRRVMETCERTLGQEHVDTLASMNNYALLLENTGDKDGAEKLFRKVLEIRERKLGVDHPDTLGSVNNLAVLLKSKRDFTAAEPLFQRALEARKRILGNGHPSTLASMVNLGRLYGIQKNYAAEKQLLQQALEGQERIPGERHPDTPDILVTLNSLAWLMATCPQPELRDGKQAVKYATRACEDTHWKDAEYVDTLATACAETGDFETAVKWEKTCLETPGISKEVAAEAASHLALYQARKPYHEGT